MAIVNADTSGKGSEAVQQKLSKLSTKAIELRSVSVNTVGEIKEKNIK